MTNTTNTTTDIDTIASKAIFHVAHNIAGCSPHPYREVFSEALVATHAAFERFESEYDVDPYDCELKELVWLLSDMID